MGTGLLIGTYWTQEFVSRLMKLRIYSNQISESGVDNY